MRRSNFQDHWTKALTAVGVERLHFHDLRHTGNTWAPRPAQPCATSWIDGTRHNPRRAHLPAQVGGP
ncbi:hypothetical protein [Dactylosporangium sp. NPDC005555]|uniref:hypothetical protein n=1 Tax=Dactylosporangium sp. NPDC005555 TaxID=3154889 RepID=UPI0033AF36B1